MDRIQQQRIERMMRDAERFSSTSGSGGAPGAKGPTGSAGPRGPEGPRGEIGLTGASGLSGAKGNQGPIGDQGPPGDKGPTGDQGPAGPAGAPGTSPTGGALEHLFFAPGSDVEVNNGKPTGQSAAFSAIDPSWPITAGTDFTVASDSITCNFSGTLCIEAHLFVAISPTTNGQRPAPQGRFMVNGTETGPVGASSYIRDSSGHESASVDVVCYIEVSNGDSITFGVRKGSTNNASVQAKSAYSQYSVRRIK